MIELILVGYLLVAETIVDEPTFFDTATCHAYFGFIEDLDKANFLFEYARQMDIDDETNTLTEDMWKYIHQRVWLMFENNDEYVQGLHLDTRCSGLYERLQPSFDDETPKQRVR